MERYNEGKPELSNILYFDHALDELARVCSSGRLKYEDEADGTPNWKSGDPFPQNTFVDSALRHLRDLVNGDGVDEESGKAHLAHAAWNCLAALYHFFPILDDIEEVDLVFSLTTFELHEALEYIDAISTCCTEPNYFISTSEEPPDLEFEKDLIIECVSCDTQANLLWDRDTA